MNENLTNGDILSALEQLGNNAPCLGNCGEPILPGQRIIVTTEGGYHFDCAPERFKIPPGPSNMDWTA